MKKWIALLLSCVMLLAMVAGCGGTPAESPSQSGGAGETAPQSAAPDGETKTYKVGFSNVWVGNTWGVQCVNELEAYLRNNEQISEYYIYNADNDTPLANAIAAICIPRQMPKYGILFLLA